MINTRISYLYRDAGNYKVHNEVVVAGLVSVYDIDIIMDCLYDGEYFIPSQVGLPEKRFGELTEDDHCWFELSKDGFELTEDEPDVDFSIRELTARFMESKDNWNDGMEFGGESVEKHSNR